MLSSRQIELLEALVNRIVPADDAPGGWEAGVGSYLFRQFEADLKHLLPMYAFGLNALDQEAQMRHHQPFDQLAVSLQDEILTDIEGNRVRTAWPVDPATFFRLAIEHSTEGYYSDPGNGGNIDGVSWVMIGFEVRG